MVNLDVWAFCLRVAKESRHGSLRLARILRTIVNSTMVMSVKSNIEKGVKVVFAIPNDTIAFTTVELSSYLPLLLLAAFGDDDFLFDLGFLLDLFALALFDVLDSFVIRHGYLFVLFCCLFEIVQ